MISCGDEYLSAENFLILLSKLLIDVEDAEKVLVYEYGEFAHCPDCYSPKDECYCYDIYSDYYYDEDEEEAADEKTDVKK